MRDNVFTHLHFHLDNTGHGRHVVGFDLAKLLHPIENGRYFLGQRSQLFFRHSNPGKPGDVPDCFFVDRHEPLFSELKGTRSAENANERLDLARKITDRPTARNKAAQTAALGAVKAGKPGMTAEIVTIEGLREKARGKSLIGLDLGTKTIGIALSDPQWTVASPRETIRRTKFNADAERLVEIILEDKVGGLVLGLPLNMDGSEGPRVQSTRTFARNLTPKIDIPIFFWDERLSTVAVTRTLLEADTSRKRRDEVVDKMAAAFILQGVLERLRNPS